jgi:hypothetical protein
VGDWSARGTYAKGLGTCTCAGMSSRYSAGTRPWAPPSGRAAKIQPGGLVIQGRGSSSSPATHPSSISCSETKSARSRPISRMNASDEGWSTSPLPSPLGMSAVT